MLLLTLAVLASRLDTAAAQDPFADAVAAYTPGINGGFGDDQLPDIILGPPVGGGATQGSLHVLALGSGGSITLQFDLPVICDRPGVDFTVFENAFHSGTPAGPVFTEYGYVAVSQDGEHFIEFPYDAATGVGLAGQSAVLSTPDNGISPLDPSVSGGDTFDLADVGLAWAAYVRVTDVAGAIRDTGDLPQFSIAPNAGFDLDAIAAVHACDPDTVASATPTPTQTTIATAAPSKTVTSAPTSPAATATATSPAATQTVTASVGATQTGTPETPIPVVLGDLNGDGNITSADLDWLVAELFDGDAEDADAAAGGSIVSGPAADVNADRRITAADVAALLVTHQELGVGR
ncbi:MAG: dockerin type I domain-containing protein [bacterium]